MGKGNRNSQKRAQDKIENADQLLAMQKAKSQKSFKDKAITIAIAAIALVIVATLLFSALSNTGIFIRNTNVMSSDSVTVDAAMMSFFLNESIMTFYTNYYQYIQMGFFSVDLTQDLKTQKYGDTSKGYAYETYFLDASFKGTWYDYFMKPVKSQVETYIVYASAGKLVKEKDLSLTADQKKEINTIIKNINDGLALRSLSWSDVYGKGVKESDARRCYELIYRASNFATYYREKLEDEVKEEEIVDFREENKSLFYTADCLTYTIKESSKGVTDEQYDKACKEAKAAADAIAQAKSPAEFVAFVEAYEASLKKNDKTETETGTETGSDETEVTEVTESTETTEATESESETEKDISDKLDNYKDTIKYEEGTGNELNDFLFGNDETGTDSREAAEEGDVTVIEETGTETEKVTTSKPSTENKEPNKKDIESSETDSDESESESETETDKKDNNTKKYKTYKVTVYYVIDPMHYDTEKTHDFAYLISDEKNNVFDVSKAFGALTEKTLDLFVEKAEDKYNAIHESADHQHKDDEIFAFRKLEKQAAGWFVTNGSASYKDLDSWIESADRKNGDVSDIFTLKIVSTDSAGKTTTSTQYAFVFFAQHNEETWYVTAFDGAVSENFNEWYEAWLKENTLKVDDAINNIDTKKSVLVLSSY